MKDRLFRMLDDLKQYKRDKNTLMQQYVMNRLDKSFNQYDQELQQSLQFLTRKHEKSLIKRMKTK